MGVTKIMATQEYTHAYRMWKNISADDCTWVRFKTHFQEEYMDREDLEKTSGTEGYGGDNHFKHGEMQDYFINFVSSTAARDASFTEMTMNNGNLSTKFRQQEDRI